jgi:hypothetical protein
VRKIDDARGRSRDRGRACQAAAETARQPPASQRSWRRR